VGSEMTPEPSTVLVIGAGRHGGTGARVVERLREHDREVRVLVRSSTADVALLRGQGAEVVIGDLHDRRTLVAAVEGISAVYFAYPIAAGAVQAAANLASVLRTTESPAHLVVMSMGPSAADSPSALGRAQWAAEEVFSWAGLEPTVLRVAALFYENIPVLHGASIRRTGRFGNSFGTGPAPWISGRDAADLAVAALLEPSRYPGTKLAYPPGAELLSHAEVAEMIAREIGSPVEFVPVSGPEWQSELEELAAAGGVVNIAMAQHISSVGAQLARRSGASVPPDPAGLAEVIGHGPLSLAEFIRDSRRAFARIG
jgi:uncharacterized protein YbjT (DUF2867 family)